MVEIRTTDDTVDPSETTLVEGMPGVGLVGKIATDHLIDRLEMVQFAEIRGEGIPPVTVFDGDERGVHPPIRLYIDADEDLVALRSDVPVHVMDAPLFAERLTEWVVENDVLPVYLGGLPAERDADEVPSVEGIGVGDGQEFLDAEAVPAPDESGMISGPCGALLSNAADESADAIGLMVDTDPRFPDPQGAHALIKNGINPVAGVDVETQRLVEEAEDIMEQRKELAQRMQQADQHEASQVSRTGMFQ
ncbi:MAG: proteasome assembly chaperone family protein [Halolamina sp.]